MHELRQGLVDRGADTRPERQHPREEEEAEAGAAERGEGERQGREGGFERELQQCGLDELHLWALRLEPRQECDPEGVSAAVLRAGGAVRRGQVQVRPLQDVPGQHQEGLAHPPARGDDAPHQTLQIRQLLRQQHREQGVGSRGVPAARPRHASVHQVRQQVQAPAGLHDLRPVCARRAQGEPLGGTLHWVHQARGRGVVRVRRHARVTCDGEPDRQAGGLHALLSPQVPGQQEEGAATDARGDPGGGGRAAGLDLEALVPPLPQRHQPRSRGHDGLHVPPRARAHPADRRAEASPNPSQRVGQAQRGVWRGAAHRRPD
mmetsp:Transcript_22970/g.56668  ORF Transcript_22970/g.56668 Transcript_22970/m.56668 type:complete len:319 (+) Transcript_22970:559-1515(+)